MTCIFKYKTNRISIKFQFLGLIDARNLKQILGTQIQMKHAKVLQEGFFERNIRSKFQS